ncbi:MAG: hypothetical protein AAGC46_18085 [Solirubrobacteraceae bacterium]|nr:hypothetical protein [Patulibacter sp.]
MTDEITADTFTALEGSTLTVRVGIDDTPTDVALTVDGVEVGEAPGPGFRAPFTVALRGAPDAPVLPQDVHQVHHPTAGTLDLFLVPHGPSPDGGIAYSITFG